jgi:hypothetical protein
MTSIHLDYPEHGRAYLRWVKKILAALDAGQLVRINWSGEPMNREQWRAEFLKVLNKRINLKAGPEPHWRKLDPDYQTRLMRDSRRLQDIARWRCRVYQFETEEARSRYGHRLARHDD